MKKLKFDHELAQKVLRGEVTTCWRLFDDKDLSVNDEVVLIDKVDPDEPATWQDIGTATITSFVQKRLGDVTDADMEGHRFFHSKEEMLARLQQRYGSDVTLKTPVKIIHFDFSADIPDKKTQILSKIDKVVLYADGGSRGNPGPSASGYVIQDANGTKLTQRGIYLGITTNNQAEYTALKLGLEEAKSLNAQEVAVFMDSTLVVNQMKGIFKVKNRDLWPIHEAIKQLCSQFRHVTFTQVPRAMNKLADAAVNQALDEQLTKP